MSVSEATSALPDLQRQLTVVIGDQRYGLPGDTVVEVIRRPRITRVPHGPVALLGLANLRGTVLPVVSLARLMGEQAGPEARVAVLDHNGLVGILVDAVLKLEVGTETSAARLVEFAALLEAGFKRPATQGRSGVAVTSAASEAAQAHVSQRVLVSFFVREQTFALPLASVIEVLRLPSEVARLAHSDSAVLGIANIRDRSLPIISLGGLLGFHERQADLTTDRVLVVEHEGAQIGLVADAVDSIVRLPETAIDRVPAILQRGSGEADLDAIGRQASGPLVSILSIPKLFANAPVEAAVAATGQEKTTMAVEEVAGTSQEQFVVFDLAGERYGLPIAAVDEVLRLPERITRVPNGPRFVSGIINLRGRPIPIIDQHQRFDTPNAGGAVQPRVIVVSFGSLQAGFVVDAVSEILSVDDNAVTATPPLSAEGASVFSRVASTGDDALILLIDPQELLSRAEQDVIAEIAARQAEAASR